MLAVFAANCISAGPHKKFTRATSPRTVMASSLVMSGLLNLKFATLAGLWHCWRGHHACFLYVHLFDDDLCVPLVAFMSDVLFCPSQRLIEGLDLVRHARLWLEVVRLNFIRFLNPSLYPLQCTLSGPSVTVKSSPCTVSFSFVLECSKLHRLTTHEAALLEKRRVFFRPVVRAIFVFV